MNPATCDDVRMALGKALAPSVFGLSWQSVPNGDCWATTIHCCRGGAGGFKI